MGKAYGEYQLQLVAAGEDGLKWSTMIVMGAMMVYNGVL